ncbi:MAG TPA: hypothetical protein VK525_20385 [Candidatus Saccharimonadales bacterium]|nr:hypothetical protein [Candidatus Saccharimonadales bacterium]
MTLKAKLIIVGVAVGVVFSFIAHRYLGCTAQVLQHLTAGAVLPAESLTKVTAAWFSS